MKSYASSAPSTAPTLCSTKPIPSLNGYGGYTKAYGLKPDFITLGKSIAGGIPVAVYGFTREVAERINASFGRKSVSDPMGISGTLSGNAFAIAAMRETLTKVATEEAFEKMFAGQKRLSDGLDAVLERHNIPWSVTRSGARCELQFMPTLPKNGSEAKNHFDWELMYYTHLFLTNRGLLITPFHNTMLIPPVATEADIDLLIKGWDDCLAEIAQLGRENWHKADIDADAEHVRTVKRTVKSAPECPLMTQSGLKLPRLELKVLPRARTVIKRGLADAWPVIVLDTSYSAELPLRMPDSKGR